LGEEYFFIRTSRKRKTVSPFHLPKLPIHQISVEADVDLKNGIKRYESKNVESDRLISTAPV
jgi:hypothetical protein